MVLTPGAIKKINKLTDNLALAVFFIIGLGFIYLFVYLNNSQEVQEYLNKVNRGSPTAGLRLTVIYGMVKLISIILGLLIPIAVIYKIIKDIRNKKNAL